MWQGGKHPKRPENRFAGLQVEEGMPMDDEMVPEATSTPAPTSDKETKRRSDRANKLVQKLTNEYNPERPQDTEKDRCDLLRTCKGLNGGKEMAGVLLGLGITQEQIDELK
jgi:predicted flap endonuclease-1-like 5' DNA nuclease